MLYSAYRKERKNDRDIWRNLFWISTCFIVRSMAFGSYTTMGTWGSTIRNGKRSLIWSTRALAVAFDLDSRRSLSNSRMARHRSVNAWRRSCSMYWSTLTVGGSGKRGCVEAWGVSKTKDNSDDEFELKFVFLSSYRWLESACWFRQSPKHRQSKSNHLGTSQVDNI